MNNRCLWLLLKLGPPAAISQSQGGRLTSGMVSIKVLMLALTAAAFTSSREISLVRSPYLMLSEGGGHQVKRRYHYPRLYFAVGD